ncbi:hypothetical protein EN858_14860 [Mesorhizobium sp. M4B.F.Ca.ET.215.01.1.1]|uniref:hypothetical protein n=1 Tax=unclassified Mesorhizobium TaxID=325217 RepID=UPI001093F1D6|nr:MULTISPECIES: hypothetical protein [unclassified Mesorhizobium]TGQ11201.1 hypothetical protein EN858_14860 [Mesorhizobium sp. M4B.F.Ca.ET.215.01.1.1]TGR04746.1 hypothetical protein EN846_13220 [Mesorhizobium sp. M4B.F.Ca.ET.203.01.1.1]
MSYASWHVGMKVVCVDDQPAHVDRYPYRARMGTPLKAGQVYTIRAFQTDGEGVLGVLLQEATSNLKRLKDGRERPFGIERFRPVKRHKTSIEVFNRILRNPHVRIKEDA